VGRAVTQVIHPELVGSPACGQLSMNILVAGPAPWGPYRGRLLLPLTAAELHTPKAVRRLGHLDFLQYWLHFFYQPISLAVSAIPPPFV